MHEEVPESLPTPDSFRYSAPAEAAQGITTEDSGQLQMLPNTLPTFQAIRRRSTSRLPLARTPPSLPQPPLAPFSRLSLLFQFPPPFQHNSGTVERRTQGFAHGLRLLSASPFAPCFKLYAVHFLSFSLFAFFKSSHLYFSTSFPSRAILLLHPLVPLPSYPQAHPICLSFPFGFYCEPRARFR